MHLHGQVRPIVRAPNRLFLDILIPKTASRTPNYPREVQLECTNPQHVGHLFLLARTHSSTTYELHRHHKPKPIGKDMYKMLYHDYYLSRAHILIH